MCLFFVPHAASFKTNSNSPRGPVRTSEAQRTQLHYSRSQRWTVAARIQSKSDSEAGGMGCLPSFLLLCFASQEAGKKARDD